MTKSKKHPPAKRNPIAKAVKKIRPQVVPDARRKKLARAKLKEVEEAVGDDGK